MNRVLLLAATAALSLAANSKPREHYEQMFYDHISKFNLKFADGNEFAQRLSVFANNVDLIESHNSDQTQTYKMALNKFAHLTFDEFLDEVQIGGARIPNLRKSGKVHKAVEGEVLADTIDWVSKGAVTPVKNQGSCGSCWSFSATGAMEGAYYIKHGSLVSLSEQQFVSCDTGGQDAGCNGGWMDDAFTYATNGITTEDQYSYTSGSSGKSGTCKSSGYSPAVSTNKATPFTDVQTGSVSALKSAVSQQPVSIAIQANQLAFQFYSGGILTGKCGQNLDHGVLLVGYGTENGVDYWKVKNSWGPTWGESGYIRIKAGDDDLCGVLDAPSYPNVV